MGMTGRGIGAVLGCALLLGGPGAAADLDIGGVSEPGPAGTPRYFPRSDGIDRRPVYAVRTRAVPVGCTPRRAPVPTNAPDDPSYAGSAYGLSHPSYYGFTPPLGVDDPFGRSLLPYCR
ncbi:hypothetical protein MKL01_23740 [Methylobacterium sp. J-070]|nr:hypothetical protein [Methylobacterium sp. J-070]MCJ2052669.1 hypothetical protein [Methylobacterium sp. J-070]